MYRQRFFATLHFARELKTSSANKVLQRLATKIFYIGYSMGWMGWLDSETNA